MSNTTSINYFTIFLQIVDVANRDEPEIFVSEGQVAALIYLSRQPPHTHIYIHFYNYIHIFLFDKLYIHTVIRGPRT